MQIMDAIKKCAGGDWYWLMRADIYIFRNFAN